MELAIGLSVLFGLFTRTGLTIAGLWMVTLIFGSSVIEQYDVVGIQLLYSLIFAALLYCYESNAIAIDYLIRRPQR